MVAQAVKLTVSRWRPLALGAAVGYVTLLMLTQWAGSRRRAPVRAERNGFHRELFV